MSTANDLIVFAHRGFRGTVPENTLLAMEKGLEAGADWLELDVAASSDGVLLVIHDDSLRRTTDVAERFPGREPWAVYDFSWAEIESLDAGSWYEAQDPFGQIASGQVGAKELASFAGLRIPSLRACLEFARDKGWKVDVEIKDARGRACDPWIVEATIDLIRELGMIDSVLLSSFNLDYLRKAKAIQPRIAIGALVEKVPPPDPLGLLRELGATSYNPGMDILDEPSARKIRAAGFELYVWTVNEEADMRRLMSWGVNGLFTDFPDRLLRVLGRNQQKDCAPKEARLH